MNFRSYSLLVCALVALPAAVAPSRAAAQESAGDANAQYRRAFESLAKGSWADARRLLLPLWEKSHTWDVAAGLGQAEFLLKNYAAGARYAAFALANVPPKEKPKTVEHLRAALAEMKEAVGTVRISVSKDSAEIYADGERIGTSPLADEVFLNPGPRLLEARLSNGALGRQTLEVGAGKMYQVALIVEKSAPETTPIAAPKPQAALQSDSPPPAPVPPPNPANAREANWAPVLVSGGLAVVALGLGTGFALDASSAKSDAANALSSAQAQFGSNPCTPLKGGNSGTCQTLQSKRDRQESSSTIATVSFISGGVLAAAAVASYFIWAKPDQNRIEAWGGPTGGGLRVLGSF